MSRVMDGGAPRITRHYFDHDGGQLHYRRCGSENNPPLLLLHQSPSSSAMYELLMPLLADRFFVLAPDTPGFGQSDALIGGFTIAGAAALMAKFIRGIGAQPCCVFGHHTGATIATQLVADAPESVSALAMSGPTLLSPELQKILPGKAQTIALQEDGRHLLSMWKRIREKDNTAPLSLTQREALLAWQCGDDYAASYRAVSELDYAALLKRVSCRTLVFAGDQDPLFAGLDETLSYLANGQKVAGPAQGKTYACERQVEVVADILGRFFS